MEEEKDQASKELVGALQTEEALRRRAIEYEKQSVEVDERLKAVRRTGQQRPA